MSQGVLLRSGAVLFTKYEWGYAAANQMVAIQSTAEARVSDVACRADGLLVPLKCLRGRMARTSAKQITLTAEAYAQFHDTNTFKGSAC